MSRSFTAPLHKISNRAASRDDRRRRTVKCALEIFAIQESERFIAVLLAELPERRALPLARILAEPIETRRIH
jgi:hypothetical protein